MEMLLTTDLYPVGAFSSRVSPSLTLEVQAILSAPDNWTDRKGSFPLD